MASIDADAHSISFILNQILEIPEYQRDYSWTPKREVKALLDDFAEHLSVDESGNFGATANDDYLLGPMISTKSEPPHVIDGQQRLITIFLVLCALRRKIIELRPIDGMVGGLNEVLTKYDQRSGSQVARIRHHDSDLTALLTDLATQDVSATVPKENGSISRQRAVRAYKFVSQRLAVDIPQDPNAVVVYAKFLRECVKLIHIQTPDIDSALYVFERANDRGKPLDPSDLLKNLIFRESDAESFAALSKKWKSIQRDIEQIPSVDLSVQLIDYLRWKHLVMAEGFYSTRRNFYSRISEKEHREVITADVKGYIAGLGDGARTLKEIATTRAWQDGTTSPALEGIYAMAGGANGGGRQKQHWPLILAASRYAPNRREAVGRVVEKLLFVSAVTQLKSQTLELLIRQFAAKMRDVADSDESVMGFLAAADSEIQGIKSSGLFEERFSQLNYVDDRLLVRYILIRVHSALRQDSGRTSTPCWPSLASAVYADSQIEHIWPQHSPQGYASDEADDESRIHEIGNLVLIDSATNQAAGGKAPEVKLLDFYPKSPSEYVVARNLHERLPLPGVNTQPIRVSRRLPSGFTSWGAEQAMQLTDFYRDELELSMSAPYLNS